MYTANATMVKERSQLRTVEALTEHKLKSWLCPTIGINIGEMKKKRFHPAKVLNDHKFYHAAVSSLKSLVSGAEIMNQLLHSACSQWVVWSGWELYPK